MRIEKNYLLKVRVKSNVLSKESVVLIFELSLTSKKFGLGQKKDIRITNKHHYKTNELFASLEI